MADEIIFSPFSLTTFFISMGIMEGKTKNEIVEEMGRSWLPTYIVDWTVWPAAQLINFMFVPSRFRVLYVSVCTLGWNVYLSGVSTCIPKRIPETVHCWSGLPCLYAVDSKSRSRVSSVLSITYVFPSSSFVFYNVVVAFSGQTRRTGC